MANLPFNDLHSFKDFVGFVKLCAPDDFPVRHGVRQDEQWTLNLAFEGLRLGLQLAIDEKGPKAAFTECQGLVEEAYSQYREG